MTDAREIYTPNSDWLNVAGQPDPTLAGKLFKRVSSRVEQGEFNWDNIGYINDLSLKAAGPALDVDKATLEKLRRACQLWNVDLQFKEIKSHRPVIGVFIVAAKKIVIPIIRALLKDSMRQQRSFNAAMLAITLDLYEKLSQVDRSTGPKTH